MNEFLNTLLDKLSGFLPVLDIPIKIGLIGGILLAVLFFICYGISFTSKIDKYRKLLIAGSRKFAESDPITDENVDIVYDELQKHPEGVSSGWSRFLEQRVGAPSDYFPARDVLSAPEFSGKRTLGKILYLILGALIWVVVGLIGYHYHSSYLETPPNWTTAASLVMGMEFLIIPVGIYIIGFLLLDIILAKRIKRLSLSYTSFCETLDSRVAIAEREEEEFISDNLAEINKRVEELVGNRTDEEIIEVVTVPKATEPDMGDFLSVGEILKKYEAEFVEPEPEPVVEEPVVEEPAIEEPVIEEPVVEEPVVEEPVPEVPAVEEPEEEPIVEEPVVEEPVIEEPAPEVPAVEEPEEEPVVEEPVVEEPVVEEPVVEEPVIEVPAVEEPVAEEPVVEEPRELTPEEIEKNAFVEAALEKEEFVRLAIDNEDLIKQIMEELQNAAAAEPAKEEGSFLDDMTEEESYEWLERVLQICEMALNDPNVSPKDLNDMGELLSQALGTLTDPTCQAAITDYLGMIADKYYSLVEE